jgi:hypothetical protein
MILVSGLLGLKFLINLLKFNKENSYLPKGFLNPCAIFLMPMSYRTKPVGPTEF